MTTLSLLVLACASGFAEPRAQTQSITPTATHMSIFFNGTSAGESTYLRQADGTFTADVSLSIGTIRIVSKIKGHFAGEQLKDYVMERSGQGGDATVALANNKVTVTAAGKKVAEADYPSANRIFLGNLHPALSATLLRAADWSKKEPQTISGYMIDGGQMASPKVTPLDEKATPAGTVRRYRVDFGPVAGTYALSEDGRVVGFDVPSQKLRFVADGWTALYEDPFARYPELSPATAMTRQLPTQRMRTRDGAELVQDVFLPEGEGPFPTIFVRTPYDRRTESLAADMYAKRGYAYVVQDCRGRTDSGGTWEPFVNETNDGYDSIDWIAKQPWCDGNVGMIGASYGGFAQWAAAASHHPALKCIIPQVSPPLDAMRNLPYDHGIFFLYGDVWWGKVVAGKQADMSSVLSTLPNPKGFATLPLSKVDDSVLGHNVPFFDRWLEQEGTDHWKGWNFYGEMDRVTIPALHISGWWDGDEIGTNLNWEAMRRLGRRNQWLIYGSWTHFFNSSTRLGDTDYGQKAMIDLDTLYIRWFDTWLKHKNVGLEKIPHVQAFVTGANRWLSLPTWPSPDARVQTFYLSAPKSALGRKGAGELVNQPPANQKPSVYVNDPSKAKIPPQIFNVDPAKASTKLGPEDGQNSLRFLTAPLPRPMAITGPYEVDLRFKTSARDTDFFAVLVDVAPNGDMRVFGQTGKLRCSYLQGFDHPRPLTPNKVYRAVIRPWDSAHELAAGHRLGLLISSSGFPLYARNLGTGEPIKNATRMIVQKNTVFHDAIHPSNLKVRVLWE